MMSSQQQQLQQQRQLEQHDNYRHHQYTSRSRRRRDDLYNPLHDRHNHCALRHHDCDDREEAYRCPPARRCDNCSDVINTRRGGH